MNLAPVPASADPASCNVCLSQAEHFKQTVVVRKYRPVFWYLPQLPVKILNGIGSVNQRSYRLRILKTGWEFRPMSLPGSQNFRIFRIPFGCRLLCFVKHRFVVFWFFSLRVTCQTTVGPLFTNWSASALRSFYRLNFLRFFLLFRSFFAFLWASGQIRRYQTAAVYGCFPSTGINMPRLIS